MFVVQVSEKLVLCWDCPQCDPLCYSYGDCIILKFVCAQNYGLPLHRYSWEPDWPPQADPPRRIPFNKRKIAVVPPFPEGNVWLMLAQALNKSPLCLSMTSPSNPFQTCLVAMPLEENEWNTLFNLTTKRNCTASDLLELKWWCDAVYQRQQWFSQLAGWYFNNSCQGMDKVNEFPPPPFLKN